MTIEERMRRIEIFLGLLRVSEDGFEEYTDAPVVPRLRARRVSVVDAEGREVVDLIREHGGGSVRALIPGQREGRSTYAELYAFAIDGEHAVGLSQRIAGDNWGLHECHQDLDTGRIDGRLMVSAGTPEQGETRRIADLR